MVKVEFRGRILATDSRDTGEWSSFALFCPVCGEIWGRVHRGPEWYVMRRHCEQHPDVYSVGGSFFQNYKWLGDNADEMKFLRQHPLLLQHEFNVHMEWGERFIK